MFNLLVVLIGLEKYWFVSEKVLKMLVINNQDFFIMWYLMLICFCFQYVIVLYFIMNRMSIRILKRDLFLF